MIHLYTNNSNDNVKNTKAVSQNDKEEVKIIKASEMATEYTQINFMSCYSGQTETPEVSGAFKYDLRNNAEYMTVMANTMSKDDFAKMMEDGHKPSDMTPEESINTLDQIKATMAKNGVVIAGYNDDLSVDDIEEIVGSKGAAEAIVKEFKERDLSLDEENVGKLAVVFEHAGEIGEITDGMCDYLLRNAIEPTIDNLYTVRYSAAEVMYKEGGYFTDEYGHIVKDGDLNTINGDYLIGKVNEIAEELGITDAEEKKVLMNEAGWLVDSRILCNKYNLGKLHELRALNVPLSNEVIAASAASALERGNSIEKADPTETDNFLKRAVNAVKVINEAADDDLAKLTEEEKELTVSALEEVKGKQPSLYSKENAEYVKNSRILAEVRLRMTVEAGYGMLKRGIAIETVALSETVDTLKALEDKINRGMFGGETGDIATKASLFKETKQVIAELPYIPAKVVGDLIKEATPFTLKAVFEVGVTVKEQFEKALTEYEALGTNVRNDLGDSFGKAFKNVDNILEDEGLEINEINRKAVRILGYSEMEITADNIEKIGTRENELQRVIAKMTPAATLELIKNNVNPLTVSMEELEAKLDEMSDSLENNTESYARFICKLDRAGEITAEEKESFIGIYRLLDKIEKSDGKALGDLIKSNAMINFKNLLTAVRTGKSRGINYKFDDSVKEMVEGAGYEFDIGTQIAAAFDSFLHSDDGNILYNEREYERFKNLCGNADNEVIDELVYAKEKITLETVTAMADILVDKPEFSPWKKMKEYSEKNNFKSYSEAIAKLTDSFEDKETANKAYTNVVEAAREAIEGIAQSDVTGYLDIKSIKGAFNQISVLAKMTNEENYELPVDFDDDTINIRLKITHKSEKEGKVFASFETKTFGRILGQFNVRNNVLNALIAGDDSEGLNKLKENEFFEKSFTNDGFEEVTFNYVQTDILNVDYFRQHYKGEETDEVTTKQLYNVAKTFIKTIQKAGKKI